MTGDLCRDTIGIRAATSLAKYLKVPADIALRTWTGYEPGRAEIVNEMDDKEIYEALIDTGPRGVYRIDLMRQNTCDVSVVWIEKQ